MRDRPAVSVVVPFAGSAARLPGLAASLARLRLGAADELLIAHNHARARAGRLASVQIVPAPEVGAPGYARNIAVQRARGEWVVFIDADTVPDPGLLDAYFHPPPQPGTGILAGAIRDVPGGTGLAARHSVARGQMSQRVTLDRAGTPFAQTANVAVRREAFAGVGGFRETVRAGEDADLCFRLRRAGWQLEERPAALVEHRSRGALRPLLCQLSVHGAAAGWLQAAYPGEFPPLGPRALAAILVRCLARALAAVGRGQRERAALALLDAATIVAFESGRRRSNLARALEGLPAGRDGGSRDGGSIDGRDVAQRR